MKLPTARDIAIAGILALVYVTAARLGLQLDAVSRFATLVWPPTGIALAALVLLGVRYWPGIALGAFIVNRWTGAPVPVALGIALGNTVEALLAAFLLRRFVGFQPGLTRVRDALGLLIASAGVSAFVCAVIGVFSLWAGGLVPASRVIETWRAWWVGDAIGALVVAPLVFTWSSLSDRRVDRRRVLEAVALAVMVLASSLFVFFRWPGGSDVGSRVPYLVFPAMIAAALRFGPRGGSAVTALISGIAIWGTARGNGPFVYASLHESLLYLQAFIGIVAITALALSSAVAERAKAVQIRDDFLAVVSHDLRSPLTAIALTAEYLRAKFGVSEASKSLGVIELSAERMARLIRDLLDFSALQAGQLAIVRRAVDAAALLDEAVEMHRPLANARAHAIRAELPRDSLSVHADKERLLQVLSNLIGNAIKFTPNGGSIAVRADVLDGEARFSVVDTGRGMSAFEREHAFERYWQARPDEHRGAGLGLFIAREIVRAHGGRIWINEATAGGCTFSFTLPLADESAAHASEASSANSVA